jgi:xanthine dehydrogenase large subunit
VKLRLPREVDMVATGKRHGFDYRYTVGFDGEGRVLALDAVLAADAGRSLDMTPGVVTRALTHTYNAYWIPHFRAVGYACRTNKQSNTAFRGFGGPQGVVVMEDALDRIAIHRGRDPVEVRALNFYAEGRDETPYGQKVDENHLERCWAEGCYKVMLMSAAQRPEAHRFYTSLGFDATAKQAFVISRR